MARFSSSSTRIAAFFALVFLLCACSRRSTSQRQSVCGSGPHTLDRTDLDVYLLPNTYVTLQAEFSQRNISSILWYAQQGKDRLLPSQNKRTNRILKIGPINKTFNLLDVQYAYSKGNESHSTFVSETARLYVIGAKKQRVFYKELYSLILLNLESQFSSASDKGFESGQAVQGTTGSSQPVFCFRLTPENNNTGIYAAPVRVSLIKETENGTDIFRTVASNRYYEEDGCVWMVSLQQNDTGAYRIEISDCFPSHYTSVISFSLLFNQSATPSQRTYSSTQNPLSQHGTTKSTNSRTQTMEPTKLQMILDFGRAYDKSHILTVFPHVNSKLTVKYNVSGRQSRRLNVTVRHTHNGKKAKRIFVHQHTLTIENVLQSDTGFYQVIARDGDRTATLTFALLVQAQSSDGGVTTPTIATKFDSDAVSTGNDDALIASVALLSIFFVLAVIIAGRYRILWRSAQITLDPIEMESTRSADADDQYETVGGNSVRQTTKGAETKSEQSDTKVTANPAYGIM